MAIAGMPVFDAYTQYSRPSNLPIYTSVSLRQQTSSYPKIARKTTVDVMVLARSGHRGILLHFYRATADELRGVEWNQQCHRTRRPGAGGYTPRSSGTII